MAKIHRKGIDMDTVRPWVWATMPFYPTPVEIVSYPIPREGAAVDDLAGATIMVRLVPGDPTSLREVDFADVACFEPDRHEWWHERERVYYSDDPSVFLFADEIVVRGAHQNAMQNVPRGSPVQGGGTMRPKN